ncbi:alpha-tocopherol transfer protein-like [Leptidea sinapis]|uniref:CRAL-TRIO domain-containing protein n=1 Tax=Leptidea sinapis TaxID=189913 RepID=A0A5E4PV48_9NEOP|nr:alpha-tocopherol transfer protein-like [Leptidea sinapis]VVC88787.1 unnamed protein product [Leptidea sinapis]
MAYLEGASLKQEEMIKQDIGEGPGDLERGIMDLRSMCAANPYLPDPDTLGDHLLGLFLRGCRMNTQRARKKFETFCYSRSRYRDIFEDRSFNELPLSNVCKYMDIAVLPKLTDEAYRVTIFRIKPGYPESAVDIAATVKATLLVSDVRMHDETLILGDVFIYECSNMRASLAAYVAASANIVRRSIYLAQAAYPQRMKRIHVVGAPGIVSSSLNLMRACVNEKVKQRYYLHSKVEELLDHMPARILPAEWGGKEESIEALSKKMQRRVEEVRDYIRQLNTSCRAAPLPASDKDIYGVAGAFRKLEID